MCHSRESILLMFILLSLHEKTTISTTPEWDASPMQGLPPGSTINSPYCKKMVKKKQY